jgi:glycosyltransferase involved in cell wall biosynthesis
MRILVLSKRQYSGYDFLDHRFGRLREFPLELARSGHNLIGVALSYRRRNERTIVDSDPQRSGSVTWHSINLSNSFVPRPNRYAARVTDIAHKFQPELIWACSDAYHAVFGSILAKRLGIACVIDLYDNFESFRATSVPGVLPCFKRAVRSVQGVTCVSRSLANFISQNYGRQQPTLVLENSARTDLFFPRERIASRKQLGLPEQPLIVGTAGALDESRGVTVLFEAFHLLTEKYPKLHLALAGPRSRSTLIPSNPVVLDLGTLSLDTVPVLLSALDVAVICNRDTAFGRYCFPQKAYEIIASRVPLVAAAVGTMKELLIDYAQCLYEPDNPLSLARAIERQLVAKTIVDIAAPSWSDSATRLEGFFEDVLANVAQSARPLAFSGEKPPRIL